MLPWHLVLDRQFMSRPLTLVSKHKPAGLAKLTSWQPGQAGINGTRFRLVWPRPGKVNAKKTLQCKRSFRKCSSLLAHVSCLTAFCIVY